MSSDESSEASMDYEALGDGGSQAEVAEVYTADIQLDDERVST